MATVKFIREGLGTISLGRADPQPLKLAILVVQVH